MTFPRRAEPKIQPTRMRRQDAEDIADELIAEARIAGEAFGLFLLPTGECKLCPKSSERFDDWCARWPCSFVGTYDAEVERERLIGEILRMDR